MTWCLPMQTTQSSPDDPRLQEALHQLQSLMIPGETLEAWAVQPRIFALLHRRVIIAATSGRFIALARQLVSGYQMTDVRWQDLRDAKLHMGIFGADLTLNASSASDLASGSSANRMLMYRGFRKEQTREVYRLCQAQEQAWREKRRVRDLEEMRARSGGIQLPASPVNVSESSETGSSEPGSAAARLQQAKQMLEAKLISDAEYEAIKARILGSV